MSRLVFSQQKAITTKTSLYFVMSGPQMLGTVKWYAPWRRYVFFPEPTTLFDSSCLKEVVDFLDALMAERRWCGNAARQLKRYAEFEAGLRSIP